MRNKITKCTYKTLPKDAEVIYYYYHHGDYNWRNYIDYLINTKNHKDFMKEFKKKQKEKWCYLPKTASVFSKSDPNFFREIDITEKKNFDCIKYGDAECG